MFSPADRKIVLSRPPIDINDTLYAGPQQWNGPQIHNDDLKPGPVPVGNKLDSILKENFSMQGNGLGI